MLKSVLNEPTRPVLRYYGGKWKLAPWIIGHFPPHQVYVEPFGGAGSVLLRKPRSRGEVYNDLDRRVVDLFHVLRDPALAQQLIEQLRLTPFARTEFEAAQVRLAEGGGDVIERARSIVVCSFMSHGASWRRRATGFRSAARNEYGTNSASDWVTYPEALQAVVDRLRGVVIECRPALDIIRAHDGPGVLFYLDPPYLGHLRGRRQREAYSHELDNDDHVDLLTALREVQGMVILSGIDDALYADYLPDWYRVDTSCVGDKAKRITESLWLNPLCWERQSQLHLFGNHATGVRS